MHPYVHCSTICNSQDMETTWMSIYRWMGKEYGIYIPHLLHSMKHYSAIKKNGSNNMNGPRDNQTKWSKSERERQIPYDITYMWNLKYDTNESIYEQKQIHRQTCGCGGSG